MRREKEKFEDHWRNFRSGRTQNFVVKVKSCNLFGRYRYHHFQRKRHFFLRQIIGEKVVLLDVKKRGKNLIQASQKIESLIDEIGKNIPRNIKPTISNDQSPLLSIK